MTFRQGSGRLCLDFVRTLRRRGTPEAVEELPDAAALSAWITQCGPLPATAAESDVRPARILREAVSRLLAGDLSDLEKINDQALSAVPAPHLDRHRKLSWSAADPVSATLALIARDTLDLVASPALERVRTCADPDCGALFLDSSRPGSRRWCSMGTCGNRAKKERRLTHASAD